MDINEIKRLLEAFYNGETSSDEEQILQEYFNTENVADELQGEKELFLRLYQNEPVDVPAGLETRLENLIDELNAKEIQTKTTLPKQANKKQLWKWVGSIAAGVALLVSAGLYFNNETGITTPPDTPGVQFASLNKEDQQKVQEAQDALVLLSSKFNKGTDKLAVVSTNLDKTNDILNKAFKRKKQ